METTPYKETKKIKPILKTLDKIFAWPGKRPSVIELTPQQYEDWLNAISDDAKKFLSGNPKYKGIELKKNGASLNANKS